MKATKVERQLKGTSDPVQNSCITNIQLCINAGLCCLSLCLSDGTRSKIDARHLPAGASEGNDVRTGAAANVDGATGLVCFDEFKKFRGTNSRIPRGLAAEIPKLKQQAADNILHSLYS